MRCERENTARALPLPICANAAARSSLGIEWPRACAAAAQMHSTTGLSWGHPRPVLGADDPFLSTFGENRPGYLKNLLGLLNTPRGPCVVQMPRKHLAFANATITAICFAAANAAAASDANGQGSAPGLCEEGGRGGRDTHRPFDVQSDVLERVIHPVGVDDGIVFHPQLICPTPRSSATHATPHSGRNTESSWLHFFQCCQ